MKWEYMHGLATNNIEFLNDLGSQEWELICSFRDIEDDLYYIYKRPKPLDIKAKELFDGDVVELRKAIEGYFGGKVD